MFDFNSLFNKAFPSDDGRFDPTVNYYTVLVNCVGQTNYYNDYENQRRIHMGDSYYKEIDVSNDFDINQFRTQIMSLGQEFAVKVNIAYVFLMDIEKGDYKKGFFKDYLEIVREFKQSTDTVAVVTILPEEAKDCGEILDELENDILENEVLYIYNKTPYREYLLSDAICGIVLLHSSKKEYNDLRTQEQQQMQMVHNAITGLPEAGAAAVRAKKPIFWSSIGCTFRNPKMDHLRSYVAIMCDKVRKMSSADYSKLCGELYAGMAEGDNRNQLRSLLKNTVDRIPRVEDKLPPYEGYTLKDYFNRMFGSNGTKIVELSFKATLSMLYDEANEGLIANTANMLFDSSAEFHSEDLFADVCRFLEEFSVQFEYQFAEAKNAMTTFMEQNPDNDSFDEDFERYINDYIKYHELQKRSDFWNGVESYVKNHKSYFSDACARSKALSDSIKQLKIDLQLRNAVNIDSEAVRSYPAQRIINAQNDPEISAEIRELYKAPENVKVDIDTVNMNFLFRFVGAPGFSDEINHEFATGNGAYTVYMTQYIGKYLHFLKGGKG